MKTVSHSFGINSMVCKISRTRGGRSLWGNLIRSASGVSVPLNSGVGWNKDTSNLV